VRIVLRPGSAHGKAQSEEGENNDSPQHEKPPGYAGMIHDRRDGGEIGARAVV
jgi:hypothetical protein